MANYMKSCLLLYTDFTETIGKNGEFVFKKLKVKNAFIEKIRLVTQVHGRLHDELFISICSLNSGNNLLLK